MGLGEQLRAARLARKLSPSDVAAATRMKVQTVEQIEAEDFSKMAAPIYARGFIKLYADFIGLDPKPLLNEYAERFGAKAGDIAAEAIAVEPARETRAESAAVPPPGESRPVPAAGGSVPAVADVPEGKQAGTLATLAGFLAALPRGRGAGGGEPAVRRRNVKSAPVIVGALIVLVFLFSMLAGWMNKGCLKSRSAPVESDEKLKVAVKPPQPYFE